MRECRKSRSQLVAFSQNATVKGCLPCNLLPLQTFRNNSDDSEASCRGTDYSNCCESNVIVGNRNKYRQLQYIFCPSALHLVEYAIGEVVIDNSNQYYGCSCMKVPELLAKFIIFGMYVTSSESSIHFLHPGMVHHELKHV